VPPKKLSAIAALPLKIYGFSRAATPAPTYESIAGFKATSTGNLPEWRQVDNPPGSASEPAGVREIRYLGLGRVGANLLLYVPGSDDQLYVL
jgi:hypothetical protein